MEKLESQKNQKIVTLGINGQTYETYELKNDSRDSAVELQD